MATTPISELVATIELVRTMKQTLDGLVDVIEKLGERVERLEKKVSDDAAPSGRCADNGVRGQPKCAPLGWKTSSGSG